MYKFYFKGFIFRGITAMSELLAGAYMFFSMLSLVESGAVLHKEWWTFVDVAILLLGWHCFKSGLTYLSKLLSEAFRYCLYIYKHYKAKK